MLAWASRVTRLAESEEVIFTYASVKGEERRVTPVLESDLRKRVETHWQGGPRTKLTFHVLKGTGEKLETLHLALMEKVDLVIVARYAFGQDMAIRLARKAPCSVMSIPEDGTDALRKIVVPNDFSEYALTALDVALAFAEAQGLESVENIHVYDLGNRRHHSFLPDRELMAMKEEDSRQRLEEFLQSVDTRGREVAFSQICSPLQAPAVIRHASDRHADLIVTGCRGKNTVPAVLLGSHAEELLRTSPIPVLAAKTKGTSQNLLEALLE